MPRPPKPWFRFYSESLESRKAQSLGAENPRLFVRWVNLLCLANVGKPRGYLPQIDDISFALRCPIGEIERDLDELIALRFVDKRKGGRSQHRYYMHDWEEWQKESDVRRSNADETPTKLRQNDSGSAADLVPFRTPRSEEKREGEKRGEGEEIARAPATRKRRTKGELRELTDEDVQALALQFPNVDVWRERDKFVDYVASKSPDYTDHVAAFRNWLRRAEENHAGSRSAGGAQSSSGPLPEESEITRYANRPIRILEPNRVGNSQAPQHPGTPESRLGR